MEEWLRARMLAASSIIALVADRLDWGLRPQGEIKPAIALHLISNPPARRMTGKPTWRDARVQVDVEGNSPGEAIRLRRAVVDFAEGLRDVADGKKYRVFVIDDDTDTKPDAARIAHRAQVDLRISYQV